MPMPMPVVKQLTGAWVIGSMLMGTLAVLFTLDRGVLPFRPLASLPALTLAGVVGVAVALVAAFALLVWGTPGATWLPETPRGRVLWVVLVVGGGVGGCAYMAAVTFAANMPLDWQLVLAYVAGGLPFTLITAMLVRPSRANLTAAALAVLLLVVGYLMPGVDLLQECARLLQILTVR